MSDRFEYFQLANIKGKRELGREIHIPFLLSGEWWNELLLQISCLSKLDESKFREENLPC